ncbi:MAG: ribbon-helix-helix domain-containing protein [Gemmatimonadota bacterium]|nr:ribbon-helix-helix domain-containing protein [Gemmatimonadota bacterium]
MKKIKTTVYLNAGDYRKLRSLAAEEGRTAAELVREAVAEYAERATGRLWPRSIGIADSGDPHFAENCEDYLDGFGEEEIDYPPARLPGTDMPDAVGRRRMPE